MKAAVVTKPNKIEILNVPEPVIGDYDVLCETLATAVCSGTDNHIVSNHPYFKAKYPLILGHEGIGRVIKCGPRVRYLKEGDIVTRVMNKLPEPCKYNLQFGAFAEKSIATDWMAMREDGLGEHIWKKYTVNRILPEYFDPIESTMIITWRETYAFLTRMKPQKNNLVVIIGSGATALAFIDHIKNLGLRSIVIGSPRRKHKFIKKVECFISYRERNYENLLGNYKKNVNIIIDTIGNSETLNRIIFSLASNGKIGLYGLDNFLGYYIKPTIAKVDFMFFNGEYYDEGSAHGDIVNYIQSGKLNAWDYLDKSYIYHLEEIEEALAAVKNRLVLKSVVKF